MQEAAPCQVLLSAELAPAISRRYTLVPLPPRKLKGKAEPTAFFATVNQIVILDRDYKPLLIGVSAGTAVA
jgi:class 3 adenylate cyclase